METYIGAGGNFIDTADVYGMGVSEKLIGEFLKHTANKVYVGTKLGRRDDGLNGWPQNFTYDSIRRHVEDSLNRLGLEQLFLEQLHCVPTEQLRRGEVFEHLRKIQEEGLIKHFGVSVETTEEALICLEQHNVASLQFVFNIFRQHIADEFFNKAAENNVALIARAPLAGGLLRGRLSASTNFCVNEHRNFNANGNAFNIGEQFSGIPFEEGVLLVDEIEQILPHGSMAAQSIRWILDHAAITTVIPEATKAEQIKVDVSASALPILKPSVRDSLRLLYDSQVKPLIRGTY